MTVDLSSLQVGNANAGAIFRLKRADVAVAEVDANARIKAQSDKLVRVDSVDGRMAWVYTEKYFELAAEVGYETPLEVTTYQAQFKIGVKAMPEDAIRDVLFLDEVKQALGLSGPLNVKIAYEHGGVWAIVDDHSWDVDDPAALRTFSVVDADPGFAGSGIYFEEV